MRPTIKYDAANPDDHVRAISDIREYLGDAKYNRIAPVMATYTDPRKFEILCGIAGIEGFPVVAWYESLTGIKFVYMDE